MSKKNAILLTATHLFAHKGLNNTSMAELSKITGAAGGTIFHHFKNKEDLFLNVINNVKETVTSAFKTYFLEHRFDNGLKMVEGAIMYYLNLAETMEDRFLLLHRHDPYKLAETNSTCRQYLEEIYDCLLDVFERGIKIGKDDGSIQIISTRNTALIIFSMIDGIVRFNTYKLYSAGALYDDLMASCRKILTR